MRLIEKVRALLNDDRQTTLDTRLGKLVARRKAQAVPSPLERLSVPAAEDATAPLYDQSVYGSLSLAQQDSRSVERA